MAFNGVIVTTKACMVCHIESTVELTADEADAIDRGAFMQDALPARSNDFRELLITGTHASCWDDVFAGFGDM